MLTFGARQMAALAERSAAHYLDELVRFAVEQFPDEPMVQDRHALEACVRRVQGQASAWGFPGDADVRKLLVLRLTFVAELDRIDWLRDIADDPFGRKVERMIEGARARRG